MKTTVASWDELKKGYPVGVEISGRVDRVMAFGLFISVDGVPAGVMQVDGISLEVNGEPLGPEFWPKVGDSVQAVIIEQSDHNQELKSRLR
ncbi:hypothetical protein [Streptomyces sp. NPDC018352]|uniref:hypothetical protein n=1 Tax=Streptomyces sp. NPDC018352 TaxID=3157194 RepID=UPI0033FE0BD8